MKQSADRAVGSILTLINENGSCPSSSLIVCFHSLELEALDVEIGLPLYCDKVDMF